MKTTNELRQEFESTLSSLGTVKYSLERNDDGEYRQAAVFHMWSGYCLSALDNNIVNRNDNGFIDNFNTFNYKGNNDG